MHRDCAPQSLSWYHSMFVYECHRRSTRMSAGTSTSGATLSATPPTRRVAVSVFRCGRRRTVEQRSSSVQVEGSDHRSGGSGAPHRSAVRANGRSLWARAILPADRRPAGDRRAPRSDRVLRTVRRRSQQPFLASGPDRGRRRPRASPSSRSCSALAHPAWGRRHSRVGAPGPHRRKPLRLRFRAHRRADDPHCFPRYSPAPVLQPPRPRHGSPAQQGPDRRLNRRAGADRHCRDVHPGSAQDCSPAHNAEVSAVDPAPSSRLHCLSSEPSAPCLRVGMLDERSSAHGQNLAALRMCRGRSSATEPKTLTHRESSFAFSDPAA